MAETKWVTCPASQWTALSTAGQTNVTFKSELVYGGIFKIAATTPNSDTDAFPVTSGEKVSLGSLGASDIVYYKPGKVDETVKVIRG